MLRFILIAAGIVLVVYCAFELVSTRRFIAQAKSAEGRLSCVKGPGTKHFRITCDVLFTVPKDKAVSIDNPISGTPIVIPQKTDHYSFETKNWFASSGAVPVLYHPDITQRPPFSQLDTREASLNMFTSLYAYSILAFVPGTLFLLGGVDQSLRNFRKKK